MADFATLWNEVIGHVPSLSPFLAQRFVNRAWREIRQRRSWSFLLAEGFMIVPERITAGTVTATQFSTTVTPNAAAITALNAAGTNPLLGQRQFRLTAGRRVYNIASYDGVTITLKEPYQETNVAGSAYEVLSVYFRPPSADFIRIITIRDLITNYHIRVNYSAEEVNRIDPQRNTQGDPLYLLSYKTGTDSVPLYELWPTPSSARSYQVWYQSRGSDLATGDSLPLVIPDHMVLDLALYYAYRWAESAKGSQKELGASDWRYLAAEARANFDKAYVKAAREDDEIFLQSIWMGGNRTGFMTPVDANYNQDHITDWW